MLRRKTLTGWRHRPQLRNRHAALQNDYNVPASHLVDDGPRPMVEFAHVQLPHVTHCPTLTP